MTISVKMMNDIAQHAAAMANEAMEMAACMQLIVDDCAEQLAAKKAAQEPQNSAKPSGTDRPTMSEKDTIPTDQPASMENPLTIVELRAMVAELSTPENRPKIKGVLTKFGVKKLTELNPAQYQDFMTEVGKVCTL